MPWAPEEISAWSIEELEAEIRKGLPEGWTLLSYHAPDGFWECKIQSLDDKLEPVVHVDKSNADRRLGLLDIYGWLWLKSLPKPPEGSPWGPRRDLTIGVVTGHANIRGSEIPDPEDLDPAEVALIHKTRK